MSITPRNLLDLSQSLIGTAVDEVTVRCSIGRSYYAAFHLAKDFHRSLSQPGALTGRSAGVHETLYQQLESPTISKTDPKYAVSKKVAAIARDLKRVRAAADYELKQTFSKKVAQQAIDDTLRLKALVESRGGQSVNASTSASTQRTPPQ